MSWMSWTEVCAYIDEEDIKTGKKYVIEVEDEPFEYQGTKYWPAAHIPRVFFDAEDLAEMDIYEEPTAHKFEVGDVCIPISGMEKPEFIITKITPQLVSYMWNDGSHSFMKFSDFERQAKFIRHSNYFEAFLQGGLK